MIYVIDHNDSFTHNVVHQFALFDKVECDNYDKVNENKMETIVMVFGMIITVILVLFLLLQFKD